PLVDGAPQRWYRTSAAQVVVPFRNAGNLTGLSATVDDAEVTVPTGGDGIVLPLARLADGTHVVHVEGKPGGMFGDSVDEVFTIHVDTRRPALALDRAPSGWQAASELSGQIEDGSTLALSYGGKRVRVH